ncbi:MAG TPA: GerMN domain-containing protein [Acidimicrobiales bacterium]
MNAPRVLWRRRVAAVVLALVAVASAACGVPHDESIEAIANDDVPYELLEPAPTASTSTTTTAPPAGQPTSTTEAPQRVELYFVRRDRIERRDRLVPNHIGLKDRLALLAAPLPANEVDAGFRSALPPEFFTDVSTRGGVATVDLTAAFLELPPGEQVLAFAQITYTLTDLPGIGQVAFTLNGEAIPALDDEGVVVDGAVSEDTYRDIFASSVSS